MHRAGATRRYSPVRERQRFTCLGRLDAEIVGSMAPRCSSISAVIGKTVHRRINAQWWQDRMHANARSAPGRDRRITRRLRGRIISFAKRHRRPPICWPGCATMDRRRVRFRRTDRSKAMTIAPLRQSGSREQTRAATSLRLRRNSGTNLFFRKTRS